MNDDQVYAYFLKLVDDAGGQRSFARKVGFTPSYINDMVHKRRPLSDQMLALIGIERVVTYTVVYREVTE